MWRFSDFIMSSLSYETASAYGFLQALGNKLDWRKDQEFKMKNCSRNLRAEGQTSPGPISNAVCWRISIKPVDCSISRLQMAAYIMTGDDCLVSRLHYCYEQEVQMWQLWSANLGRLYRWKTPWRKRGMAFRFRSSHKAQGHRFSCHVAHDNQWLAHGSHM